jgi:hypothetical protein
LLRLPAVNGDLIRGCEARQHPPTPRPARHPSAASDASGVLKIEVVANSDLSVDVTFTGTLNPGDDNLTVRSGPHNVSPGQRVSVAEFDLDSGGPFNYRAYFRDIAITNLAAQAI